MPTLHTSPSNNLHNNDIIAEQNISSPISAKNRTSSPNKDSTASEDENLEMPDETYLKIFHWHVEKLDRKKDGRTITRDCAKKRYHQFIFPIGNAPREDRTSIVPAILSDLMIIFGILFPYIAIFLMTSFKVPDGFKWHGIVFLLWLTLGELSPFPAAATWELLHSYDHQWVGRRTWKRFRWDLFGQLSLHPPQFSDLSLLVGSTLVNWQLMIPQRQGNSHVVGVIFSRDDLC
jgi:hypothetical protein